LKTALLAIFGIRGSRASIHAVVTGEVYLRWEESGISSLPQLIWIPETKSKETSLFFPQIKAKI